MPEKNPDLDFRLRKQSVIGWKKMAKERLEYGIRRAMFEAQP
jgi:hypothetical protein